MLKRVLWLFWLCLILWSNRAYAQFTAAATITPPQIDAFPQVSFFLDVHGANGAFVHGIQADEIHILEDGREPSIAEFRELRPGLQVVLAVNPGDSFTIRDSQGVSRYDLLSQALQNWAAGRLGSTLDDLSLTFTSGTMRTHFSSPNELKSLLTAHDLESGTLTPDLDLLLQAVDIAADPAPRPGMERAVLFVTSPLEGDVALSLQNILSRALQQQVRIYVWLVAAPEQFGSQVAFSLRELAYQTMGDFFAFSGQETVPSPEEYFKNLRDVYYLSYESRLTSGGSHELLVEIQRESETIQTPPLYFELDLRPPDPAFIEPELTIVRRLPEEALADPWDEVDVEALLPKEQRLQILVDFPDGRARPLVRTSLSVDGEVVDENTEAPFNQFAWNLGVYTTTSQHVLQVEAVDSLGLTGKSIETLVEVQVELPQTSPLSSVVRNGPLIAGLVVLLSAAVLVLVLILGGRIHPQTLRSPIGFRRARRIKTDPVTQPVPGGEMLSSNSTTTGRRLPGWVNRIHWPQRKLAPNAYAILVRIPGSGEPSPAAPYSITSDELTIGRDKNQASLVLEDASIEALHARLIRTPEGYFRLADEGSVAGTWINYTPVSREGAWLEHGDLIHIGRVGFRFKLREPGLERKPVITLEGPPQ